MAGWEWRRVVVEFGIYRDRLWYSCSCYYPIPVLLHPRRCIKVECPLFLLFFPIRIQDETAEVLWWCLADHLGAVGVVDRTVATDALWIKAGAARLPLASIWMYRLIGRERMSSMAV